MDTIAIGVKATTLTPFAYHSLMVQSGTATLPELLGDRAVAFGLAATLGMLRASVVLPKKDYQGHMRAMPWRCSCFITDKPRLLPPLIRRLNLDEDGGYKRKIQNIAKKGNLGVFHQIQEVPHGQIFRGAIFGFDPFARAKQDNLVIRVGLHRNGMVLLEKDMSVRQVRLNAATAALFKRELSVERYCLHGLQLSPWYSLKDALNEVVQW
jgi:hypothetical protein